MLFIAATPLPLLQELKDASKKFGKTVSRFRNALDVFDGSKKAVPPTANSPAQAGNQPPLTGGRSQIPTSAALSPATPTTKPIRNLSQVGKKAPPKGGRFQTSKKTKAISGKKNRRALEYGVVERGLDEDLGLVGRDLGFPDLVDLD
ncbi:hypothetical protein H0H93_014255 [Arthromyces matolae]|nr:hypothetical protein H0H93_014255 [Arthromyces matolae]